MGISIRMIIFVIIILVSSAQQDKGSPLWHPFLSAHFTVTSALKMTAIATRKSFSNINAGLLFLMSSDMFATCRRMLVQRVEEAALTGERRGGTLDLCRLFPDFHQTCLLSN